MTKYKNRPSFRRCLLAGLTFALAGMFVAPDTGFARWMGDANREGPGRQAIEQKPDYSSVNGSSSVTPGSCKHRTFCA